MNYAFYLCRNFTAQPQKSSHDTSPWFFTFKFGVEFLNFSYPNPHLENAKFDRKTNKVKA